VLELTHRSAFAGLLRAAGNGSGVRASERTGLGIATVMARKSKLEDLTSIVRQQFQIDLPSRPRRSSFGNISFLGTGSGKWLAVKQAPSAYFASELQLKFNGLASVVDQSDALGVIALSGPSVLSTLEKGLQLDLAAPAFPCDAVAVTHIAHIGTTVWRTDDGDFELAVARSLGESFRHWLEAMAAANGLGVD
jgi:heterotetrameric sarcosine oxidase gamma subunit